MAWRSPNLIFDDPAEQKTSQRPPREGKLSNPRGARHAGCMHGENLRNPARDHRAALMCQFRTGQVYSSIILLLLNLDETATVLNLVSIPWTTFFLVFVISVVFKAQMTRRAICYNTICALNWVQNEIFDEVMDIWKISSLYGDCSRSQMCHDKTTFRL